MTTETTVMEARKRMVNILLDTIEIDFRNGGLSALEMAKSNLEDAIKGLDITIKQLDDQRFAKVLGGIDQSIAKINQLDAQIRETISPDLFRKAGGM